MVLKAAGVPFKGMRFVFVEKTPPYDVCVRQMDPDIRDQVEEEIREALRLFAKCKKLDYWPGTEGDMMMSKIAPAPAWRMSGPEVDLDSFFSTDNEAC